jgi:aspartate kinase
MLVMKFGGSSLADAKQIGKAAEIVKGRKDRRPVVVCSAHKGITDMLINAAKAAAAGNADASKIVDRQRGVLKELGADPAMLDPFLKEIEDLLRGISLVREASPRVLDHMQSFGERMSVRAVAFHLQKIGLQAKAHDAFDLGFVTDDRFGQARPIKGYEAEMKAAFAKLPANEIPVVTGFIGKTSKGEITTVGRNGSDYSATVIAAGIDAVECEIWTDTDGVMTADPNMVKSAQNIPTMSFAEASELALYGGRVLHPSTLLPAVKKNIPVRVLNTNRPDHQGTVITEHGGENKHPVTSIAHKNGQTVLTIESATMLGQPGFLAKVFDVLGRLKVVIDMISTSEVTVSMTCGPLPNLEEVRASLEEYGRVTIADKKALLCIVGKDLKAQAGLGAKVFGALSDAGVNVEMISHGAKAINLSLLIDDHQVDKAVPALHRALFG